MLRHIWQCQSCQILWPTLTPISSYKINEVIETTGNNYNWCGIFELYYLWRLFIATGHSGSQDAGLGNISKSFLNRIFPTFNNRGLARCIIQKFDRRQCSIDTERLRKFHMVQMIIQGQPWLFNFSKISINCDLLWLAGFPGPKRPVAWSRLQLDLGSHGAVGVSSDRTIVDGLRAWV